MMYQIGIFFIQNRGVLKREKKPQNKRVDTKLCIFSEIVGGEGRAGWVEEGSPIFFLIDEKFSKYKAGYVQKGLYFTYPHDVMFRRKSPHFEHLAPINGCHIARNSDLRREGAKI